MAELESAQRAEADALSMWTKAEDKASDHADRSRLTTSSVMLRRAIEAELSERQVEAEFAGLCTEESDPQAQPIAVIMIQYQGECAAVPVWPCVDQVTVYRKPAHGERVAGEPLVVVGDGERGWSTAEEWVTAGGKSTGGQGWISARTWAERLTTLIQAP